MCGSRDMRMSVWKGGRVRQPFPLPYYFPLEDPFEVAECTARALGCRVGLFVGG
jgi:hypothetical protein